MREILTAAGRQMMNHVCICQMLTGAKVEQGVIAQFIGNGRNTYLKDPKIKHEKQRQWLQRTIFIVFNTFSCCSAAVSLQCFACYNSALFCRWLTDQQ